MSDTAQFTVKVNDKVSAPSRKAKRGVERIEDSLHKLGRTAEKAERARQRESRMTARMTDRASRIESRAIGRRIAVRERLQRKMEAATNRGGFGLGRGIASVVGGNLITAAIGKTVQLGRAAAVAADGYVTFGQRSRLALGQLAKSIPGADLFEHSRALARKFGLDLFETTEQYRDFLAVQFTPLQADELIRIGADMRMLGAEGEKLSSIFRAITQIKGKNRLQLEELAGQLGEAGLSAELVFQRLEKSLGKNRKGVLSAITAGNVSADVGIAAIKGAVLDKLQIKRAGEAGEKFADSTIDGIRGRIKARLQDTGLRIVDKVIDPLTAATAKTLDRLEKFLSSAAGRDFVDRFAGNLGRAAQSLDRFVGRLLSPEDTRKVLNDYAVALQPFAYEAGLVLGKGIVKGMAAGLMFEADVLVPRSKSVIDDAMGSRVSRWISDQVAGSALDNPVTRFLLTPALGDKSRKALEERGERARAGFVRGMGSASGAGDKLGDSAVRGVEDRLQIHSPSRVFANIGFSTARGFTLGLERSQRMVSAAATSMADSAIWGPATAASSASPAAGAEAGAKLGGYTVTAPITVNVGAGEDARETGRSVADAVRREISAVFREIAMEG